MLLVDVGLSLPKLGIPTDGDVPSATLLNGEPRVILGEGVCLEWSDPGKGGGFPSGYPLWLVPYLAIISEDGPIRPMGGFPYEGDAVGIVCCCWSVILLEAKSCPGKESPPLLLGYLRPAEALNISAEAAGFGRIG